MPSPPSFRKNNPNDQPILMLNLTSNTLPLSALDDYAETMIAPRISMVSGVSQVQVQGASKYAVRVQLDPDKLHAQKIGLNEIDQALQNWNVNLPTGQLFGSQSTYNIKAGGQLMNAAAFRPIIVTYRRGAPVRLDQVANVIDSIENVMNGSWFYTKPGGPTAPPLKQTAITLQVMRQPGTNTIEVTDAVRALLPVVRVAAAAVGAPDAAPGSLADDPRRLQGHPGHDADHADPGGRRHLPLPAQRLGHADSRRWRCRSPSSARSP